MQRNDIGEQAEEKKAGKSNCRDAVRRRTSRQNQRSSNYAELEALYDTLRDEKAQGLGKKAELLKTPSELGEKKDDYLRNHLIGLGPAAIEGLKTKMANYDYSILGHQISVNAYNIVDRCEVCHAGIREPLDITPASMAPGGPNSGEPDSCGARVCQSPEQRNSPDFTILKSLVVRVVTGATAARPRAI